MNELNIYKNFNYRKLLRTANIYFNSNCKWYNKKTVFAPEDGNYTISINRYNIRICYWTDNSIESEKIKVKLKDFLLTVLENKKTKVICSGECDILDNLTFIKKIQLK